MVNPPNGPGTPQIQNSLEYQQLAGMMGMTGAFGQPSAVDGLIYLGPEYDTAKKIPKRGWVGNSGLVSQEVAINKLWEFTPQQERKFDDLIEAGGEKRPDSIETRMYWWKKMIGYAGSYSSDSGMVKSPFEMAEIWSQKSRNAAGPGGGGAYSGPTTTSYTEQNVNLTNPSTARSVLDSALGRYLGRMPNQKEYKSFLSALTMAEEAAPNVSERVVRSSGGINQTVASKGKTSGGISAQQFATEYAKSDEDYAETQLSTTGLQAFLGMLK
jgi:hypothetical protein